MLFLTGTQILGGYIYDTVGIDIKGNLDLRDASGCGSNTVQSELSQRFVISGKLSLTLYHIDIHRALIVSRRREDLTLLGRDRGISLDQSGSHAAHGLDGKGQRSNIQKQDLTCTGIACQLAALYGSAQSHTLIGVQILGGLLACQLFHLILYGRDSGGTAYQKHLTDICVGQPRILHCILYRNRGALYQLKCQLIEFCPGQVHVKMQRTAFIHADERQVNIGCGSAGKLLLGFLCRFF